MFNIDLIPELLLVDISTSYICETKLRMFKVYASTKLVVLYRKLTS